jgi:hypothetical protein
MSDMVSAVSPFLGVVFLLVGAWVAGWVLIGHHRYSLSHRHHPIPLGVEGTFVVLLGLPFLLSVGNLLLGVRIDTPALGGVFFLLLLGGWWRATRSR